MHFRHVWDSIPYVASVYVFKNIAMVWALMEKAMW